MSNAIILFDGVCTLCTWSVQFILRRDPLAYFRFAALQSPIGQQLLQTYGCSTTSYDSVILIENDLIYISSDAALRIARHLKGTWPVLALLLILPRGLRDWFYMQIATHRYRWFGQTESCMIAAPGIRARFLDSENQP